jgi:hypothetical protein
MIKNLLVVVPTHTGQVFASCMTSLIANINILNRSGIKVSVRTILYEAYPARVKNKPVKILLDNPDYDSLLTVDYDLGFEPTAIAKLVLAEKNIVGGAYPFKTGEGFPVDLSADTSEYDGLIAVNSLPGGFTLIHRSVFEKMRNDLLIRESEGLEFYYDTGFLFDDDPRWYGEDKTFFRRVRRCGYTIWMCPDIHFEHYGVSVKTGNYQEHNNDRT